LTQAKRTNPNLKIPQAQVLQQTLKQLEAAFVNMWERGFGFPRFKKQMRSFVFPQVKPDAVERKHNRPPKIGKVSFTTPETFPMASSASKSELSRKPVAIMSRFNSV
jgi:putative transposase